MLAFMFQVSKSQVQKFFWETVCLKFSDSNHMMRALASSTLTLDRKNQFFRRIVDGLDEYHRILISKVRDPMGKS